MVADRGLQQGDLAIVNFSAKRADTGEELPGATRNSMRLDTDDADTTFLPGGCLCCCWLAGWLAAGAAAGGPRGGTAVEIDIAACRDYWQQATSFDPST